MRLTYARFDRFASTAPLTFETVVTAQDAVLDVREAYTYIMGL